MYIIITSRIPTDPSPPCGGIFRAEPYSDHDALHRQKVRELKLKETVINGVITGLGKVRFMGKKIDISLVIDKFYKGNTREAFVNSLEVVDLKTIAKKTYSSIEYVKKCFIEMYDDATLPIVGEKLAGMTSDERRFSTAVEIFYNGSNIVVFDHEYLPLRNETVEALVTGEGSGYDFVPYSRLKDIKDIGFRREDLSAEELILYEQAVLDGADHNVAYLSALMVDLQLPDEDVPDIGWYRPEQSVQPRNSPLTLMFTSAEK